MASFSIARGKDEIIFVVFEINAHGDKLLSKILAQETKKKKNNTGNLLNLISISKSKWHKVVWQHCHVKAICLILCPTRGAKPPL